MIQEILQDAQKRMDKTLEALGSGFAKIRTGRAHPSILDHVMVDYYGTPTKLSQVSNITVEDARTLSITPWEKPMVPAIEKAIMIADLGLNPVTSGQVIRVPMPPLTEERRRELTKVVREEAEQGRVSIRNVRRDVISDFKTLLKEKEITEDEERKAGDDIQKITDQFIKKVEDMVAVKEKELMAI